MSPDSERCARRGPQPLDHSEGGIGAPLTQAGDVAPLAAKYVPRVRSARREASCSCGMWPRRERVRGRMAMLRNGGGPRGQSRSSALWGTGNNDDSRSNALWGKGGRGLVTMMAAVLVLGIPLAASAGSNGSSSDPGQATYVSPGMLARQGTWSSRPPAQPRRRHRTRSSCEEARRAVADPGPDDHA